MIILQLSKWNIFTAWIDRVVRSLIASLSHLRGQEPVFFQPFCIFFFLISTFTIINILCDIFICVCVCNFFFIPFQLFINYHQSCCWLKAIHMTSCSKCLSTSSIITRFIFCFSFLTFVFHLIFKNIFLRFWITCQNIYFINLILI